MIRFLMNTCTYTVVVIIIIIIIIIIVIIRKNPCITIICSCWIRCSHLLCCFFAFVLTLLYV
uniref:Uncharacterized protein n=1 Tax=Octopus bimaculoides TaxID=37653 RepID=A0A0L8HVU9_OCTBM